MRDRPGEGELSLHGGDVLTIGKQSAQAESLPLGSAVLTDGSEERRLLFRWLGLLLHLSNDIRAYADQFQEILALPIGETPKMP